MLGVTVEGTVLWLIATLLLTGLLAALMAVQALWSATVRARPGHRHGARRRPPT